jgi:tetratricopeptide (TPR) repeat protein
MAEFHRSTGDLAAADPFYLDAVREMENALEPDPNVLAPSYANLAGLYHRMGRPDRAATMFGNAADMYARYLPERAAERAGALHNLGLQALLLDDVPRAREAFEAALTVWRGATAADDSREALTLIALAQVATRETRLDDAEALYREAIDILRRDGGPDAAALAEARQNLALFYRGLGRLDDAVREQRAAVAIREARAGETADGRVAEALNNLALILRAAGRDDEALDLYDRALGIQESALGESHPDLAVTLHNLARLRADRGELDEADRLWSRAADIVDAVYGPDAPTRQTILRAWFQALDAAGRDARAAEVRARAGGA